MVADRQRDFIIKWIERGRKSKDPFDEFFSLWIALIVASQRIRMKGGIRYRENETDRERIIDYFQSNNSNIKKVLENNREIMLKLSNRKGIIHGNSIVDTGNPELRIKFNNLSNYYKKDIFISDAELIKIVAELFNKIRNNLFHGVKVYDDKDDVELINLVNPILLEILIECESF
jgi:hypothetical protein